MGSANKRKGAQEDEEEDPASRSSTTDNIGMGAVLSHLRGVDPLPSNSTTPAEAQDSSDGAAQVQAHTDSPGWETVSKQRPSKKQKLPNKDSSNYPSITHSSTARLQTKTKISDLQSLVLYLLADGTAPQWVSVRHHQSFRKVVVLMVPGLEKAMFDGVIPLETTSNDGSISAPHNLGIDDTITGTVGHAEEHQEGDGTTDASRHSKPNWSPDDYYPTKLSKDSLPAQLKPLADIFAHVWPISTPGDDKHYRIHSPLLTMLTSPLPKSKEKKSKGVNPPREGKEWENKRTRITKFLATTDELRDNAYAIHPASLATGQERSNEARRRELLPELAVDGWVDAKVAELDEGEVPEQDIEDGSVTAGREVLAMDCEMCRTEGGSLDLTRISIVGWDGEVLMDELVKPDKPIVDYLTPYSGMTKPMLDPVQTRLSDIQQRLLELLKPTTILIGHSLNADLTALRLTHPFIIDTSMLYPHPRGPPLKSSLKWLTQKYLGREIQKGHGGSGHNSIEDARACLDLVKQKCEKGPLWGTSEASSESIFKRLARASPSNGKATGLTSGGKEGAVVDWGQPERGAGAAAKFCIGCTSDDDVVQGIRSSINGDEDGKIVSGGGVEFVWARFREVEAIRGWSNDQRPSDGGNLKSEKHKHGDEDGVARPDVQRLGAAVSRAVGQICRVYDSLPLCTAFIIYSGSGDPREMSRLQAMQQQFKREYQTKKWDELSVKWTDAEDQQLRKAVGKAREGIGLIAVK